MKSKHLAKADFLRELSRLATEMYEIGDFTSTDVTRQALSSRIEGFAAAGTLLEVVSTREIQASIDSAHLAKFGEEREERRARILKDQAKKVDQERVDDDVDWDIYDSPAKDRKKKRW